MSLRDRLLARKLPTATVTIRVDFTPEADAADTELADATRALRLAEYRDPGADHTGLRARVDAAQAAVDSHCETIRLHALPPAEFEALIAAHPPPDGSRDGWDETTLRAPLVAACAEGDMTEDDWAELLTKGPVTTGEARALFAAALGVNDRTADLRVGKDSTPTRS